MKNLINSIILFIGLVPTLGVAATADWYPARYDMVGTVDSFVGRDLYINDRKFIVSPVAVFSTPKIEKGKLSQLKKGSLIGVKISKINNRRLIDHIWVIPKEQEKKYRKAQ
jgi:hypothetical protein